MGLDANRWRLKLPEMQMCLICCELKILSKIETVGNNSDLFAMVMVLRDATATAACRGLQIANN